MQVAKRLPKDFKLPSKFSAQVQPLMENDKAVFTTSQINQGVRDIAKSMWLYTEQPTTAELQTVIAMLVKKYPHFRLTAKSLSTPESKMWYSFHIVHNSCSSLTLFNFFVMDEFIHKKIMWVPF